MNHCCDYFQLSNSDNQNIQAIKSKWRFQSNSIHVRQPQFKIHTEEQPKKTFQLPDVFMTTRQNLHIVEHNHMIQQSFYEILKKLEKKASQVQVVQRFLQIFHSQIKAKIRNIKNQQIYKRDILNTKNNFIKLRNINSLNNLVYQQYRSKNHQFFIMELSYHIIYTLQIRIGNQLLIIQCKMEMAKQKNNLNNKQR
ncbi:unnamed protein product [Paramecium sonneborni]|uniref:Uncharacterized protein n=1 Tax=Paramecium sonneborni TaxID=65129 RepID=A0A8S1NLZ2_9CILI|nr:unnamed protein product [Paramecium sonneborni]